MTEPQQQPAEQDSQQQRGQSPEGERVVVLTEGGMGVARKPGEDGDEEQRRPTDLVEEPAKVMRLGSMIKQLLEEVRNAPLDEAGRQRLAEIHRRSLTELERGLSEELVEELDRITLPFTEDAPTEAELRIAQAQLVGWLEGLFHGIQTAIVAQQMAAQAQLQQMRRALPVGHPQAQGGQGMPQQPSMPGPDDSRGTGQYL
ncbi:bacterial proteasome activator family protein [Ornithinicoccus halotolerans]|uniref:bacterial proteasome activator family protein n=1 Tax=Ornithinicoccus halotolerans TaxID=1748220 RepID=UPI0012979B49|nr:bacterial proteasome activator family protein [Ornithinicoccus halotolerans]